MIIIFWEMTPWKSQILHIQTAYYEDMKYVYCPDNFSFI
jgi:hypothetical protein